MSTNGQRLADGRLYTQRGARRDGHAATFVASARGNAAAGQRTLTDVSRTNSVRDTVTAHALIARIVAAISILRAC